MTVHYMHPRSLARPGPGLVTRYDSFEPAAGWLAGDLSILNNPSKWMVFSSVEVTL